MTAPKTPAEANARSAAAQTTPLQTYTFLLDAWRAARDLSRITRAPGGLWAPWVVM